MSWKFLKILNPHPLLPWPIPSFLLHNTLLLSTCHFFHPLLPKWLINAYDSPPAFRAPLLRNHHPARSFTLRPLTSVGTNMQFFPRSLATLSPSVEERSAITTLQPCCTSLCAVARPKPLAPPATRQARPLSAMLKHPASLPYCAQRSTS